MTQGAGVMAVGLRPVTTAAAVMDRESSAVTSEPAHLVRPQALDSPRRMALLSADFRPRTIRDLLAALKMIRIPFGRRVS